MNKNTTLRRFLDSVSRLSPPVIMVTAIFLIALIGVLDYLTGYETSFAIFYVVPVGIVAWRLGPGRVSALAILSGIVWLLAELAAAPVYSSPLIPLWNSLMRMGFFYLIGRLLHSLRTQEMAAVREREGAEVAQHITLLLVEHIGQENRRINAWLSRRRSGDHQTPPDIESASLRIGTYLSVLSEASFAYPYYSLTGGNTRDLLARIERRLKAAQTTAESSDPEREPVIPCRASGLP